MILSMTGFASKNTTLPGPEGNVTVTMSIKALNSRFFEVSCKLPFTFSHLETEMTSRCKAKLKRGHVFLNITASPSGLLKGAVEPSLPVVRSYLDAIETVKKSFKIEGAITISDLVQLPNIFSIEERGISEDDKQKIMALLDQVVDAVVEERTTEGTVLAKDLEQRRNALATATDNLEKITNDLIEQRKTEVGKIVHSLGGSTSEASESHRLMLYQELNKMDVHEEVVRLKSHLKNMATLLKSSDIEKGKRIDFTVQELAREINTIAAKCPDARIGELAITFKVELEKIREQAQNIV